MFTEEKWERITCPAGPRGQKGLRGVAGRREQETMMLKMRTWEAHSTGWVKRGAAVSKKQRFTMGKTRVSEEQKTACQSGRQRRRNQPNARGRARVKAQGVQGHKLEPTGRGK